MDGDDFGPPKQLSEKGVNNTASIIDKEILNAFVFI
jgi:hypothetical protein